MNIDPQSRLGPYEIIAPLGKGGMGEVWRARDTRLKRDVAIKVLPATTANDADARARFQQEAEAVAALSHPNILAIYDVGREKDVSFLVCELLQGQTLQTRLDQAPLQWQKAVEVAIAIADGVAAAHAKGIVHRDLKPANIFLTEDGIVKILDFGLASVTRLDRVENRTITRHTEPGTVLGTTCYMSPEQLRGQPVDARTDVFAFGCVLYEMLTGQRAFHGDTLADVTTAILTCDPPGVNEAGASAPAEFDRIIVRCLEKSPRGRFQSFDDLAFALRGLLSDSAAPTARPSAAADVEVPSIAVLPLTNMSADPENQYFGDGISEDIINALAHLPGIRVAARTSAFAFRDRPDDLRTIGETLRVGHVLEGSVRKSSNRVRITAQLVKIPEGFTLWSERFDRDLADVFDVQDEIAKATADRIQLTFARDAGATLVRRQTDDPAAYQQYVKGRALLYQRGPAVWRALEAFRRAVELDPEYALAWSGLADAYTVAGFQGLLPPADSLGQAEIAADQALDLGAELAESQNAAAAVHLLWKWNWTGAERAFRRSLELNPNYILARCWYGFFYLQLLRGRHDDAIAEIEHAVQADPLSSFVHALLAITLGTAGRHDRSLDEARRAHQLDPDAFLSCWTLHISLHYGGHSDESIQLAESSLGRFGRHPWMLESLCIIYADVGRASDARALYEELRRHARREYTQPALVAVAASWVGEMDEAFRLLEVACDQHDSYLLFAIMTSAPHGFFWRLHEDPRMEAIRKRMGLEPKP